MASESGPLRASDLLSSEEGLPCITGEEGSSMGKNCGTKRKGSPSEEGSSMGKNCGTIRKGSPSEEELSASVVKAVAVLSEGKDSAADVKTVAVVSEGDDSSVDEDADDGDDEDGYEDSGDDGEGDVEFDDEYDHELALRQVAELEVAFRKSMIETIGRGGPHPDHPSAKDFYHPIRLAILRAQYN